MLTMNNMLLISALVLIAATFSAAAIGLRILRRVDRRTNDRYQLLVDQHERLELLREEREMWRKELRRGFQEQQQFVEHLQKSPAHIGAGSDRQLLLAERTQKSNEQNKELQSQREYEKLREAFEGARQELSKAQQRIQRLEADNAARLEVQENAERLAQERQQLVSALEKAREERQGIQRQAESAEQERVRLQREEKRLRKELSSRKNPVAKDYVEQPHSERPWWLKLKPIQIAALLCTILALWFTSLLTALSLLQS